PAPTDEDEHRHDPPPLGTNFIEEPTGERLRSSPPPDIDDDDAPSSVRKPREGERPVDVQFDGFDPQPASEPPPESGEVPSYRASAPEGHVDARADSHTAAAGDDEEPVEPPPREEEEADV